MTINDQHNDATPQRGSVTQQDVADACGVGRATVSLALRNDPRISPTTVARIRAAAQALGYHPAQHESARRLALQKYGQRVLNHVIAVFFPRSIYQSNIHFYSELSRGIMAGLIAGGFAPLLQYTPEWGTDGKRPLSLPLFEQGAVDGIITTVSDEVASMLTHLQTIPGFAGRPAVTLMNPLPPYQVIRADEEAGAHAAAAHLLSLGHRHIMQLVHAPESDGHEGRRIAGVRQAFREAGIDPATHLHLVLRPRRPSWMNAAAARTAYNEETPDWWDHAEGPGPVLRYLQAHPQVTAMLGLNDASAIHAWYTLPRAGLRVPEDISVVGFDDTDPIQEADGANILTTVRVPLYDIGVRAAETIIRQVTGETTGGPPIVLPTELVVRGTTRPPTPRT